MEGGELGHFLDTTDARFVHAATLNAGTVRITRADDTTGAPPELPASVCVSAHGLAHRGDRLHFSTAAQEVLGKRYAAGWLSLSAALGDVPVSEPRDWCAVADRYKTASSGDADGYAAETAIID